MSVAFGFAHKIQLQLFECRVWFCASNTVTIFMSVAFGFAHQIQLQYFLSVALSFAHKIQLQRHICNIVINFKGHRISCSVSITLAITSSLKFIPVFFDHVHTHDIMLVNKYLIRNIRCMISNYGTRYACSNLI